MIGSWYEVKSVGGVQLLTVMKFTLMTRTHYLAVWMVLPYVELLYMSPPLRIGGRCGMGQRLNTCFKASTRSAVRISCMCVQIVRTPIRSKMKCGSATLRQTVPVLHSMCIAHMTLSAKYIIIKSCFLIFMPSMHHYCWYNFDAFLYILQYVFYMKNEGKTPQYRVTVTSIEGKCR